MKILLIGGTGTIGEAVVKALSPRHTLIVAARNNADIFVDISERKSIETMYESVGNVDAVVATTGKVQFRNLLDMTEDDYGIGLNNKLMGQINLVLVGLRYINDNGSFTLTSGILNRDPIRFGSSAAMVNGAIDGFVKSAAIEMTRGIRINAVSPSVLSQSMDKYGKYFPGFVPVDANRVAMSYSKSIEGAQTGNVYCVD